MKAEPKPKTYYWDSGVIIPFFNAKFEPEHAKLARRLLEEAEAGKIEIVTSTFTLVEVIKLDRERQLKKSDEDKIVAFFEKPYIHLVSADRTICESARHLIWQFSTLKPKDSVHLASALAYAEKRSLDALFAWDTDFTKLDGKATQKFRIQHPVDENPSLLEWGDSQPAKTTEAPPEPPQVDAPAE